MSPKNSRTDGRTDRLTDPEWDLDLGEHCPQAQADGVPCDEVGRQCECCERARRERRAAKLED